MKLVYASGDNEGKEIELKPPFISLGRETDNDVLLTAEEASRYHAKVEKDGSMWVVRDLGSANGVRVNGQKIHESAPLEHKDEVRVGGAVFTVIDSEKEDKEDDVKPVVVAASDKPEAVKSVDKGNDAAQKRVRLMVVALIAMIVSVSGAYLVPALIQTKKPKPQLSPEQVRKLRLEKSSLHVNFKHEKSGYDTSINDYNLSVYEVSILDRKLHVRVENLADEVILTPDPVELTEDEETELKMALLSGDNFVKAESLPEKERDNSYERLSLMIRAGRRGNAVEYINESGLLPGAVTRAVDTIKSLVERKMAIPKMSKAEAFKLAEDLFIQANRKYVEKRVHPMNIYKAIQASNQALVILDGYKQEPPYFLELQTLNKNCKEEHRLYIEDMQKKADIEERSSDKVKALERYRAILDHIEDTNDQDYQAAREKIYLLEKALKKGRR